VNIVPVLGVAASETGAGSADVVVINELAVNVSNPHPQTDDLPLLRSLGNEIGTEFGTVVILTDLADTFNVGLSADIETMLMTDPRQNTNAFMSVQNADSLSLLPECRPTDKLLPGGNESDAATGGLSLHLSAHSVAMSHQSVESHGDTDDGDFVPSGESEGTESSDSEAEIPSTDVEPSSVGKELPHKGRKRKRNVTLWKRTVRQKNRQRGLAYISRTGKDVAAKKPKPVDCTKCRFHCSVKVSNTDRLAVFDHYYSLDNNRKKDFLCSTVKTSLVDRHRSRERKRPKTISCFCYLPTDSGEIRVCQNFLCRTLAISKKIVSHALEHKNALGKFVPPNLQSERKPGNKTSDERENLVREHINSFPLVEAHYCRANSTASYLGPELNISEMYRLYTTDFCPQRNITNPVTKGVYRRIFVNDFNIRFFLPKKDQCSTCNAYYGADGEDQAALKPEWEQHKKCEKESLDTKEADKSIAKSDKSTMAITFDVQAVLPIRHAGDAQIYYLRKLAAYNFMIYETSTHRGYCYL